MRELFEKNEGTLLKTSLKMREVYLLIILKSTSILPFLNPLQINIINIIYQFENIIEK